MSEERIIRINKVLRELNISLERAVDYLKDKGIAIEANPNAKISDDIYNVLCGQFAGDKGNKEASKEVGEEKRKEKEALRLEREKEVEDKRRIEEDRLKQQEVIKARAVIAGPVQVGKIDLSPKKPSIVAPVKIVEKVETPVTKVPEIKAVQKEVSAVIPAVEKPLEVKAIVDKKEVKPVVENKEEKIEVIKEVPAEPKAVAQTEAVKIDEAPVDETITTQYQKLSGTTLTGQIIDLSQFNKPKKKKEEPKITPNKPGAPGSAAANANKNKRKRIAPKPGAPRPPAIPGVPGAPNPNKITPNVGGGGFNANRSSRPGFVKETDLLLLQKLSLLKKKLKIKLERL
jgi:translation initiation factor IF-2